MSSLLILSEVQRALQLGMPVVALESAVITHGLPEPYHLSLARDVEMIVRQNGATPATIAILDGKVHIGLNTFELEHLAQKNGETLKVSRREIAIAILKKANGGTTVAGTMFLAHKVGIQVFATGGIGGVHREAIFDISADLYALAEIPMIVVCAGAKAILDLRATLERLESLSVPVVGYQTEEFPAFYSRESGLAVSIRLDKVEEIVEFALTHWQLGVRSAVLVTQPPPEEEAIPRTEMEKWIEQANQEAMRQGIHGQALTPYLLRRVNELSGNRALRVNLALLRSNAALAARIAHELALRNQKRI
ncbi:MAG: pseudouridine-5'-phosphate glycosidase [Anaerolineales bacterium]